MRTFIAVELSQDIKQALTEVQSELKKSDADVKWVEPENIHLTLKFLGEIDERQLTQIKEILDKISLQFKPFEISLSGVGAFPKIDYPRVIWVGIEKGKDETKQIADNIETGLFGLGFQKEDREFAAHLTIGRVRSPKNKQGLKEKIISLNSGGGFKPAATAQIINSINLYQSTLTSEGPVYTVLHTSRFKT